ncbi:MAG: hypothetical protein MI892_28380 [Desulfobacterales bacterium]|nr:hypothetical protein [Desulfobacterales bacterium]
MPYIIKKVFYGIFLSWISLTVIPATAYTKGSQGIQTYYIRFDLKTSKHKISNGKLTMVPAERDFRPENFSQIPVNGLVTASPQEANQTIEIMVKKNAFIQILEQKGLKSVTTLNHDTIISYEGIVLTPVAIQISSYDTNLHGFPYSAQVMFAPLAFPAQWWAKKQQFKIKELLNNFFLFFN